MNKEQTKQVIEKCEEIFDKTDTLRTTLTFIPDECGSEFDEGSDALDAVETIIVEIANLAVGTEGEPLTFDKVKLLVE